MRVAAYALLTCDCDLALHYGAQVFRYCGPLIHSLYPL
jgi:hypothetical protein